VKPPSLGRVGRGVFIEESGMGEQDERTRAGTSALRSNVRRLKRDDVTQRIKAALERRSGKKWSVTDKHRTGYLLIAPPPKRCDGGVVSPEDREELKRLLGLEGDIHPAGVMVAPRPGCYEEYIDRAEGREPSVKGEPLGDW
jgi:hypothetical protein